MEEEYSLPPQVDDWFTYERFLQMIPDLDMTSTPGIPYMREAPTIGEWLKWDGLGGYSAQQAQRLWYDVQQCYHGCYDHYYRAFVKEEPHKIAKIESKRWRLIMCAGLAQQMLWRLAIAHQNDWLNAHPYDCRSAHGLVFCYGGWRRFKAFCKAKGLRYSRDLASWDVNAPGWVFRMICELRKRAGGPDDWMRVMDRLYKEAFEDSKIRFSNGVVVQQLVPGIMKSGLFPTISDNSLAMGSMHVGACLRSGQVVGSWWATGDDVLQSHISDSYLEALERLGCKVKEYEDKLVFMGTDFSEAPVPVYLDKHIVNYWVSEDYEADRLDSYCRLWCHDERWFNFWRALGRNAGVTLKSRAYYQFWYDSPMYQMLSRLNLAR